MKPMKVILCATAVFAAGISLAGRNIYGVHPDPSVIVAHEPLWPEGRMPDAQEHQMPVPELQWYAPPAADLRTGTCVILVSGGSYQELSDFFTLDEVAAFLTSKGVQCVNLAYRVPRPKNLPKYQSAWEDGQRAATSSCTVRRGRSSRRMRAWTRQTTCPARCNGRFWSIRGMSWTAIGMRERS